MLIRATLVKKDGRILGRKSVSEDCLVVVYGGGTFARVRDDGFTAVYQQTDTFHTYKLDGE